MSTGETARFWGLPKMQISTPAGASPRMRELVDALNAHPPAFKERDAIKAVEIPLQQLKSAPEEERIALVFESLATLGTDAAISLHVLLKGLVSQLLRPN